MSGIPSRADRFQRGRCDAAGQAALELADHRPPMLIGVHRGAAQRSGQCQRHPAHAVTARPPSRHRFRHRAHEVQGVRFALIVQLFQQLEKQHLAGTERRKPRIVADLVGEAHPLARKP